MPIFLVFYSFLILIASIVCATVRFTEDGQQHFNKVYNKFVMPEWEGMDRADFLIFQRLPEQASFPIRLFLHLFISWPGDVHFFFIQYFTE